MSFLIINADDFGLNEHCSKAIAETFEKGLVSDTTMMATGEYFDSAVLLAKGKGFSDKIGVHLNLTEGVPLTENIKSLPRFVTEDRFNKKYDRESELSPAEEEAIYLELCAQVERIQRAGIVITHADSHHHIHTGKYTAPIVTRVCREHGINKIRLHRNLIRDPRYIQQEKQRFSLWLTEQGFKTTEHFAYVMDIDGFNVPDNAEILLHPDYDKNGRLIDRRGVEDGFPVGNPIPHYAEILNIKLSAYSEL